MKTTWSVAIICALFLSSALTSAHAATLEAEDDLSSADYTGGTGWLGNWTESGDDASSATGDIQKSSGQLRFVGDSGGSNGYIFRELDLGNLADDGGVLLFFDITHSSNLESNDIFEVYARADSGLPWTEVRQFNGQIPFEGGAATRTMTLDISDFNGDDTAIRFGVAQGVTDAGEAFTIDNVEISSTPNRITLEHDELFGGADLPTASSTNTTDAAQIFDATNQPYSDDGLVVSFSGPANGPVMLFDTSDPTGGDTDLGAPNGDNNTNGNNCGANAGITVGPNPGVSNADSDGDGFNDAALGHAGENCRPLGNVLIISEDGIATDPDDDGAGGTISFDFDAPVEFGAVKFIDDLSGSVTLRFDGGASEVQNFSDLIDFPSQGENGVFLATFKDFAQHTDVIGFDVTLDGSGTVGALFGEPPGIDYGDALDTYSTLKATSGPSHRIEPNGFALHLGSAPDSESDGVPSTDALGDDAAASAASPATVADFDDEDGVTFSSLATLSPGATFTATLTATNQTGVSATACGWIDFNDDGDFDNAVASGGNNAERICVSIPNATADGTFDLDFTIPDDFVADGGVDGVYFSRFRITTDWASAAASAPTGPATDGEVEDFVIDTETLPVSIHSFESRYEHGGLIVEWGTVSETRNVGFQIWIDRGNGMELLEEELIPSKAVDPLQPQRYRHVVPDLVPGDVNDLAITAVDYSGDAEIYGLFEANQKYGVTVQPAPIHWDRIARDVKAREQFRIATEERGATGIQAAKSGRDALLSLRADVRARGVGLHRISWEDLADAGLDLEGVASDSIAVTLMGEPVSRHIVLRSNDGRPGGQRFALRGARVAGGTPEFFGPGTDIIFWAEAPEMPDELYVNDYVYRISVQPAAALNAKAELARGKPGPRSVAARIRHEVDNAYHLASPLEDPWYAARLRADSSTATYTAILDVAAGPAGDSGGRLNVVVGGLTDFDVSPDHNVRVELNGTVLTDVMFEGRQAKSLRMDVPSGLLQPGSNTVRVIAGGGTAAPADIILVDSVTLEYPRYLRAAANRFMAERVSHSGGLTVEGFTTLDTVAYAWTGEDLVDLNTLQFSRGSVRVPTVAGDGADYWISAADEVLRAQSIEVFGDANLFGGVSADFLVVAHPAFMPVSANESHPLNEFIAMRESEGWNVGLFDVTDIQREYGGGMPLPTAVTAFLDVADRRFDYEHVLLVGADSYDYTDKLGLGSISFIPTLYASTKFIDHSPSDSLLADLDGDGISDKALGRWPVRNMSDLESIVTKTLDWSGNAEAISNAVWVTDSQDPSQPSFRAQADRMVVPLELNGWLDSEIARIHFDEVDPGSMSRADAARAAFFSELEGGRSLSGFIGHGAPAMWTFQGLLTPDDLTDLYNVGNPTLIGTLTCYTTYFVSPFSDTVAHRWMNGYREDAAGNAIPGVPNGAVAIHGAATLSNYSQNEWVARRVLERQLDGMTLGAAVRDVRAQAAGNGLSDQVKNWTLLGDPTLRLD